MKATAEPPIVGGSGEEATKYIFRFKVDLGGKKRRRGGDAPQGVGPPASSSAPSTSSSSSTPTSSSPTPAPPGGIEQYLSKTRIKLLRDKQIEERKQQQAQLQSILKQHEEQLVQRQPPPPSSSSSPPSAATPTTDRVQPGDGSSPGDRQAPAKPEASGGGGGGGGGGFDVAAFLSEANAGTVHPLGAGLFHKKRARGGSSSSSGSTPPSRSTGKREAKRSSGEEEVEDYDDNGDDENGVDEEETHAVQPQPQRKALKNEGDGNAPKSGGKNENKGGRAAGWRRDAEAAAAAAEEEEGMRRSVNEVVKPIGGRRLAATAQFFPHTPPPGLGGGLSSPTSLSPEVAPSLVALAHKPHMTAAAHASGDSSMVVRRRKPPQAGAPSAAAAGKGEAQQAAVRAAVPLRQGGRHLSFVYEGLTLVSMYETYIWNYTPMHPSILHESSVRRILCGSEEDTGTPLALSVNVALAAASYWLGNAKRGNEFYRVARHHLAYLFDSSSYEVAEALVTLGVLSYGQGDVKRFGYFVHLASTICRRIGAYNSDIYAKCVIATALDPLCPQEDKASLLADYNRKAPVSPYYDSTRAIFPEHSGDVVFNERSRMLYKRYIKIRDADRHLSVFWLTLKEWEQAAKAIEQHTCTKPLPQAYMDEASLTRFLRALLHLEAMLEADYLGDGFHVTMVLYRLAARAQYHLMRGDEAKAWYWVSQSIESLQNVHTVRISPTTLPAYQTLLDVLVHFKRADLVRSVATVARGWIDIHPVCRSAVDHYLQLAEAAAATPPPASRPTPAGPTTISTTSSRRCDASPGAAGAGAVHVTAPRDYHQALVGHFPSDRFVSVTGTRHQQQLSAGLPATSAPPPTATATATAPAVAATTSSFVVGRAWGEPGRESGQDIPHGQVIPLEASGRESWSGVGPTSSLEANSDLPVPPTAAAAMGQQHRPVEDFDSGCLVGGQRKDNGRSSFDWSLFLQDLEANNT